MQQDRTPPQWHGKSLGHDESVSLVTFEAQAIEPPLNEVDDLHVVARRNQGGKRTTFYGTCRCGWQSETRSTALRVRKDWHAHTCRDLNPKEH